MNKLYSILNSNYVMLLITTFIVLNIFTKQVYSQKLYEKNFYGGLHYLSDYISSVEFQNLKENINHTQLVDSIYLKALKFFNNDISEALLCLTFSCLPFEKIRLRFLFDIQLAIPLPSPPNEVFKKRLNNLPQKLFFDSPRTESGDKDKLSHFFGNAFLSYNTGSFNLSKLIGIFVETIEDAIFIDGSYDMRDILINYLGSLYGNVLRNKKNILPSDILKIYQLLFIRIY
ncbi:hypothetical protein [Rosettibacter firmus]|uniref:hypothetical protein n=1 Tax=Rosettibacter firmus TaxID=3111522 RepID=UPI00336BCB7F